MAAVKMTRLRSSRIFQALASQESMRPRYSFGSAAGASAGASSSLAAGFALRFLDAALVTDSRKHTTVPPAFSIFSLAPAETRCAAVSYTHLRAHETVLDLVCRLL